MLEKLLSTPSGLLQLAIVFLVARYAMMLGDALFKKWVKKTTEDQEFVTYAHCKVHRESCQAGHAATQQAWKKDMTALKRAMFRIGRKLEVDDDVLEPLVGEMDDA